MASSLWIILPAFNESESLQRLIPDILQALQPSGRTFRIGVVDDGSSDGTPETVREWSTRGPVEHLRHSANQGYGAALKTGVRWTLEKGSPGDAVLFLDSDNSHPPSYFLPLVQKLEEGFDVVTASYRLAGGRAIGVPFERRVLSHGANWLFRFSFPVRGTGSVTNGFRVYRWDALDRVRKALGDRFMTRTGFPGGTELLLNVARLPGIRTTEIPFVLHYENRGSQSKIHIGRTIRDYLGLLPRFAWFSPWRFRPKIG